MKTHIFWIKTDYWVQTILGGCILVAVASLIGWMIALILLLPFGAWQLLSGLIAAIKGDKLQIIYLIVASIILTLCYNNLNVRTEITLLILILISIPIAVWKYTVTRADYISLDIIDVPNSDENVLDA